MQYADKSTTAEANTAPAIFQRLGTRMFPDNFQRIWLPLPIPTSPVGGYGNDRTPPLADLPHKSFGHQRRFHRALLEFGFVPSAFGRVDFNTLAAEGHHCEPFPARSRGDLGDSRL